MKILTLSLMNFGRFKALELSFSSGLNLISGHNEAGKTTLMDALQLMLYGTSKTGADPRENIRKRYMTDPSDAPAGVLRLEDDGQVFRLFRRFGDTNGKDRIQLTDDETGEKVSLPARQTPGEFFFGLNAEAFKRSLSIGSGGSVFSRQVGKSGDQLMDRLLNLQTGGDEMVSVQSADERLMQLERQYIKGNHRGGLIPDQQEKVSHLEHEVAEALALEQTDRKTEEELAQRRSALENERLRQEADREEQRALQKVIASGNDAELMALRRRLDEVHKEAQELFESVPASSGMLTDQRLQEGRMAMMQWHALLAQERDQSSRRIAEESESQNEDPLLDDWKRELEADAAEWNLLRKSMRRARLAAVIPGIFLIVSAVLFLSQEQRFAWASLIGFLLSSAALIGYRSVQGRKVQELESRVQRGREAAAAQKAKDEMEQRHRAEREEAARNLHQRAEEAHQAVEMAFGRAFQADQQPDEGIQVLKRFEQLRDQLQHLQMSEAALRESMERIRPGSSRESAETLADRFNREAVHPAMDRTSAEKRLSELEQEIAHRSASWQKENNALIEMETQLRIRAQGRRHADTIQREWRMEREKLDRWEQDLAMIQCARAALQQAEEQARHHFSPRLNARATELFTSLTGQASRHIRVNTDFGLTLDDLGTSELMDWKRLSTGTMEQAYLALRMAVSEIAVARPALPLLMDDPMMSYDDARASRAVRFLADYAQQKGRQIFFFTSAGRYAEALSGKNFTWLDLDQMNEDEKTRKEEHHAE